MYADSDIPKEDWEKDFMKNHRSRSQIQRLIRPEEIGRFVTFVASPDSSSFSGEALRIDGGLVQQSSKINKKDSQQKFTFLLAVFLSILIDYLPKVSYIYLEFEIKRGETMNQQQEALKAYIGLLRTSHRLEQLAKQDVTCYDLNITEFSVLELLLHKGPQTIQKLRRKF